MSSLEPTAHTARRAFMNVAIRVYAIASSVRSVSRIPLVAVLFVGCIAASSPGAASPEASVGPTASVATPSPDRHGASPAAVPSAELTLPPDGVALPYPDGCPAYALSPRRCAYIVEWAAREAGVKTDQATIQLLGDPACEGKTACSVMRSTAFVVRVRVIPSSGKSSDHSVFCGVGGQASLLCTETPRISLSVPTDGYHDIPCTGDAGNETCASPVPTIDPSVSAKGLPLRLPKVVVPIDHVGGYVVDLGDAVLPNGILSLTSATLADDTRVDVLIPDGIRLEVLGDDGKSLWNVYEQGWRAGTERVHVRLTFAVEEFQPGAALVFTDVLVN